MKNDDEQGVLWKVEISVIGRVQMVMFRDFTQRKARKLHLTGFVKNEKDGSVRVEAHGEELALKKLIDALHQGPTFANVKEVRVGWSEINEKPPKDFHIEY